jgi:hypothetical protein
MIVFTCSTAQLSSNIKTGTAPRVENAANGENGMGNGSTPSTLAIEGFISINAHMEWS